MTRVDIIMTCISPPYVFLQKISFFYKNKKDNGPYNIIFNMNVI